MLNIIRKSYRNLLRVLRDKLIVKLNNYEDIIIKLDNDVALVIFEFAARTFETNQHEMFEDFAEETALSILEGRFEEQLSEIFSPDYNILIDNARKRLKDQYGDHWAGDDEITH